MRVLYYLTIFFSSFILMIFFSDCNAQQPAENNTILKSQNISDSVIKDIPEFFQQKSWKDNFERLQASLGIERIDNGFIEWQIRLWIGHGYGKKDSSQLVIFKKENNKIIGVLYTYIHPYGPTFDTTAKFFKGITLLLPIYGWEDFIDRLEKLEIYNLPDFKKIKGYEIAMDSYGVTVEIATKNKYRIYDYPDYEGNIYQIEEAKNIFIIMKMIEEEFKIKVIY